MGDVCTKIEATARNYFILRAGRYWLLLCAKK